MKRLPLVTLLALCPFALPALALPRPNAASFAWGAQFSVSGYSGSDSFSGVPVLVRIAENSPSGFSYSQLQSQTDGADLCFIDMSGNGLPFEIDTWNTSGESLVWVTLPALESTTQFVMCWGGATSGKTVCPDNPWSGYKGVWHMNAVSPADASGCGNDGTASGAVALATGAVGSGLSYPSTSAYVTCGTSLSNADLAAGYTMEGWVNLANTSGSKAVFGKNEFISLRMEGSSIKITTPGVDDYGNVGSFITAGGEWHHVALTFVPNTTGGAKIYLDGVGKSAQNTGRIGNTTSSTELWIARNQWGGGQGFTGLLDEYRVYPGVRSAEWLAVSYAAQADAAFLTPGSATPYEATSAPQVGLAVSAVQYTNATFTASVGSLGMDSAMASGASWADLLLVVGADDTLATPLFEIPLDRVTAAPSSVARSLSGLAAETVYYAQLRATNSFDVAGESGVVSFTTLSAGPAFTATVDTGHIAPVASLAFTDTGLGGAIVRITVEASATENFSRPDASRTLSVNLAAMPTNVNDIVLTGLPTASPLYYRVTAENAGRHSQTVELSAASTIGDGNNVWSGLSEDIDDPNAYVFAGVLPAPGKTLYFTKPAGLSPVIDRDVTMPSLWFWSGKKDNNGNAIVDTDDLGGYHSCGYDLSGSGILTFTAEKPFVQESKGTNIVRNPILFNLSDNQTAYATANGGKLALMGELKLPNGVSNTTMVVNGGGEVLLGGSSPDFMGQLSVLHTRLTFANPCAMTNVSRFHFSGDPASMSNATGAPLVFPRVTRISIDTSWSGRKLHLYGAPFVFPQATFEWAIRDYNSSAFDADCVVSNLVVRKNASNDDASVNKIGTGAFIVTGETSWYDPSIKSYIQITSGCFWPQTAAGLPPTDEIYLSGNNSSYGTFGLSGDFTPKLDGTSSPRMFQGHTQARWGFTGFGGDRTVCWNGDSSLNLTNTTSDNVAVKLSAPTTATNSLDKAYNDYYAYPARFMFGNRSEFADGTVLFLNPIRYELGQNWDTSTYFESTNHVVAARMRGSLKLGNRDKTWNFSGRNFGGYLALEAENTDFTGKVNVCDKGNLLVNSNLVARSVTVQSGCGLGGTGDLSTDEGTTVKNGGALFGGEWNKGGVLTLGGKLTFESGSALRVEVGASNDRIGCVKLAAGSTLKLTAPVYVDVDTDPRVSPVRGMSRKILDWSEASFDAGSAPTKANFTARPESNSDIETIYVFTRDDGLYVNYLTVRYPPSTIMILR